MSLKNSVIFFSIFMAVGLGGYVVVRNGFYPMAVVDFDVVFARRMREDLSAAYSYFRNALLVYGSDVQVLETSQSKKEIARAVLDKLITDVLIDRELKHRLKDSELSAIAEKNIQGVVEKNKDIGEAAKKLYGLEFSDFKRLVLAPQARREILEGRMLLNKENFEEWLKDTKTKARVIILYPNLKWENQEVKTN